VRYPSCRLPSVCPTASPAPSGGGGPCVGCSTTT
jgi:hypothetical protein